MSTPTRIQDLETDLTQQFIDYLDFENGPHKERILNLIDKQQTRLVIDLNHLREYNRQFWQGVISRPVQYIPYLEKAFKNLYFSYSQQSQTNDKEYELCIGFEGSLPHHQQTPRSLNARHLNQMVLLEGIVTRCSLFRPKVRRSVHFCSDTGAFHAREYRDATMLGGETIIGNVYPVEDGEGHKLETEFGYCHYTDYQSIHLQEMPEYAPPGLIPRSIEVVLNGDLVDQCKPGDRIRLCGVYRSMGGLNGSASFKTILIANQLQQLSKSVYQKPLNDGDVQMIRKLSKKKNIVELLTQSLAPSIYGNQKIKLAILLLLLGGNEKNLANGTHIRGDLNVLLIGDPSTAKSQMLRFVLKMAPLAIATTGRGSSGVGLTAAVVSDAETGERRLEAGAMVLADRGIVCIDEFDKMSDMDRVAIHEVMEQQTVTIAKAGIHTTLNARCSVLAAANPIYGQYENKLSPAANCALPDSLMSRFDLVFVVLDRIEKHQDRVLSQHVLRIHRTLPVGMREGDVIYEEMACHLVDESVEEDESPYETAAVDSQQQILKLSFLKKYLYYCKQRVEPQLTQQASEYIAEKYAEFRSRAIQLSSGSGKVFPITPRSLEALIRLSTAHAKARLSVEVERVDAEAAVGLLKYSLFREVGEQEPPLKKKRVKGVYEYVESDSDEESDSEGEQGEVSVQKVVSSSLSEGEKLVTTSGRLSALLPSRSDLVSQSDTLPTTTGTSISQEKYVQFLDLLNRIRMGYLEGSQQSMPLDIVMDELNAMKSGFSESEVRSAIFRMEQENLVMLSEGVIFFMG